MSGVRRRFRLPRWLRWGAGLAALVFVIEYFVLPQIAGARNALHTLSDVKPAYLVLGTVLEILSVLAYAGLTRSVLPANGRPSFWTLLRIDTTTLGISHIVPGGAATASAVRFRLLHVKGVAGPDAAFGAAVQGVGSAIVLNVLLWIGLVVSIPARGFDPLYTAAAILGAALVASGVVAVIMLTRGQESSVRFVRAIARRIPYVTEDTVERYVRIAAARLRDLARDRRMLVQAVLWATLNWLLDAAALWVFIAAYGFRLGLDGLIVSFGLANVVAALPVTPGGLGLVEGVLVPTIVGFGAPRSVALLGVVSYRLVNFWMPIPAAGLTYLSLRADSLRLPESWRQLVTRSREDAQSADAVPPDPDLPSAHDLPSARDLPSAHDHPSAHDLPSAHDQRPAHDVPSGHDLPGHDPSAGHDVRSGDDAPQHP